MRLVPVLSSRWSSHTDAWATFARTRSDLLFPLPSPVKTTRALVAPAAVSTASAAATEALSLSLREALRLVEALAARLDASLEGTSPSRVALG